MISELVHNKKINKLIYLNTATIGICMFWNMDLLILGSRQLTEEVVEEK